MCYTTTILFIRILIYLFKLLLLAVSVVKPVTVREKRSFQSGILVSLQGIFRGI